MGRSIVKRPSQRLSRAGTYDAIMFTQQKKLQDDLRNRDDAESDRIVVNHFNIRKHELSRVRKGDYLQFSPISDLKLPEGRMSMQNLQSNFSNGSKMQLNVFQEGQNNTIISGNIIPQDIEEEKKYFADAGN